MTAARIFLLFDAFVLTVYAVGFFYDPALLGAHGFGDPSQPIVAGVEVVFALGALGLYRRIQPDVT